ncbi:hypothetical protein ACWGMA_20565 [Streptomyces asiaticus]
MGSSKGPEPPAKPVIRVSADTTAALEGIERFRSTALFTLHEDLVDLDNELDILFRRQI